MEHTKEKLVATLNTVYEDGGFAELTAIAIVEDEHDGELWFCANKPEDGTQVDYVLHKISEIFAAPALLVACERDEELANAAILLTPTGKHRTKLTEINILRMQAIALAKEKRWNIRKVN